MSTWDEIKDSPAGTEFTDKDGDRWRFTKTEVVTVSGNFAPQTRNGSADTFFRLYSPFTIVKTPDTPLPPGDQYLTAALVTRGIENITASTVRRILETARKIEEATK